MPDAEAEIQLLRFFIEQQNTENLVIDDFADEFRYPAQRGVEIKRGVDHVGDFQQQGIDSRLRFSLNGGHFDCLIIAVTDVYTVYVRHTRLWNFRINFHRPARHWAARKYREDCDIAPHNLGRIRPRTRREFQTRCNPPAPASCVEKAYPAAPQRENFSAGDLATGASETLG